MRALNDLGKEYKVSFTDDLVHMNPDDWGASVEQSKVEGLRRFQKNGRRVFAFVDNEPSNLVAVSKADPDEEVCYYTPTPSLSPGGSDYLPTQ